MSEHLILDGEDKDSRYRSLIPQVLALIDGERDQTAALANVGAALAMAFDWLWVGFYRVRNGELVLGPFQGPIACTRIAHGKGVCGTAWAQACTLVVPDVDAFPGHIACSSSSRSEIVVPVKNAAGDVVAVLDVDASEIGVFDDVDARHLETLAAGLGALF